MLKPLLSTRTNNFNDPDIVEKLTALWIQALDIPAGIDPSKNFYGVYHNYESDYQGDYDLSISIQAPKNDQSPNLIPLGKKYREFMVGENLPEKIYKTWCDIWALEKKGELLNRQYDADYEEYRPDGTVVIFISIK